MFLFNWYEKFYEKVYEKSKTKAFEDPVKKVFFQPGDIIFAKVKGHPHWPCRIDKVGEDKSLKLQQYHIFFFGTHATALLEVKYIWPYGDNKEIFGQSSNYFNEGLA